MNRNIDPFEIEQTGRMMGKARKLLAYGGLDGVLQRPLHDRHGRVFPHFAVSAKGGRFVDSTGQEFVDWVNGWGPVLLGYQNPKVQQAIIEQMKAGPTLSLVNPVELEVAELIESLVPCAEMVAFGKNGSDSLTAAIRIARAATQRDIILQFGFHGFHDWYTCLHPGIQGITPVLREYVDTFEYNDLEGLKQLLSKHQDRVAAVVMEPVNMWMPEPGYLEGIRELTQRHGALLIFDEMVTAFRVARGGAGELFGVQPDLACLGKGMANGMPLSAVVGKRNLMQRLPACGFGMTFRGETLSLAAAKATLEIIRDEPVCEHLSQVGQSLRNGFEQICQQTGIGCELHGPNARMTFSFQDDESLGWSDARDIFLQECLLNGVMTNGNLLPSWAHDQQDIEFTLDVFRLGLEAVATVKQGLSQNQSTPIGGSIYDIKSRNIMGFVEVIQPSEEIGDSTEVIGWILLDSGCPEQNEFHSRDNDSKVIASKVERPDLVEAFPSHTNSNWAGFRVQLPNSKFVFNGKLRFSLNVIHTSQNVFQCVAEIDLTGELDGPWPIGDGVLYL